MGTRRKGCPRIVLHAITMNFIYIIIRILNLLNIIVNFKRMAINSALGFMLYSLVLLLPADQFGHVRFYADFANLG